MAMGILDLLYSWIPRPYPTPNTGNMAFQQNTALPQYDLRGAGRPVFHQFQAFQKPVTNTPVVVPEGYGGLFAGQFVVQPLSKPSNRS